MVSNELFQVLVVTRTWLVWVAHTDHFFPEDPVLGAPHEGDDEVFWVLYWIGLMRYAIDRNAEVLGKHFAICQGPAFRFGNCQPENVSARHLSWQYLIQDDVCAITVGVCDA